MIKTEVSSSIAQQVAQLIPKLNSTNNKVLKTLLIPLGKLTLAEDYALDELVYKITLLLNK